MILKHLIRRDKPVLVGTITIEASEELSQMLEDAALTQRIKCKIS